MKKVNFFQLANFFPKQKFALECTKLFDFVLYGGTAGSGKSRFLRWAALYWLLKWASEGHLGVQVGIFCESYPTLYDRQIKYIKQEFPEWLGKYQEQKHEFHLDKAYGGGIIAFRNLDDPSKYQSSEFALVAVDELTRIPQATFDFLRQRMRWPGIKRPKFIAATNPYGEYLTWVRQFWIEKNFPASLEPIKNQFFYVEAKPEDNPYLPPEYFENLKTLSEPERRAFLEGDWYAFEKFIDEKGYQPLISAQELQGFQIDDNPALWSFKPCVFGVDVGAGGDKSVVVVRNKFVAKVLFAERLQDTMALVSVIGQNFNQYFPDEIVIDTVGVGQGVYDRLYELGWGRLLRSAKFGNKPTKPDFKNLKAELYWKLREWLLQGGRLIKDERWNELLTVKYKHLSDRTIMIQPKEELLKAGIPSPDVADALALTFVSDLSALEELKTLTSELTFTEF